MATRIDDHARFREEIVSGFGPAQLEANLHASLEASARRDLDWRHAEGFVAITDLGPRLVAPPMDAAAGGDAMAIDPDTWTADPSFVAEAVSDWITDWRLVVPLPEQEQPLSIAPAPWGAGIALSR